ncbi:MAG: 4'-phosphopantetheinyl transferase family protein [Gammaproteobacteria bacterium]
MTLVAVIADASAARLSQPGLRPCLESDDVHVWCAHIPSVFPLAGYLEDVLSDEERKRLRTIWFERDRHQFVVGRAALRNILSRYLDVDAKHIALEYERHGKPVLSALCNPIGVHFSVSHSVDWVVCAVARGRAVGVDIEYQRSGVNYVEIAERVFSAAERRSFQRVPARAREEVFFNVWTLKEAYVKAIGQGLFYPFSEIDVTLRPAESPRLLRALSEPYPARWSLQTLYVAKRYTGALAVAGPVRELALWEWNGGGEVWTAAKKNSVPKFGTLSRLSRRLAGRNQRIYDERLVGKTLGYRR